MAGLLDDLLPQDEPAATQRYAPAPRSQQEADARLADVAAAEDDIRAWAESKRPKAGRSAPPASKEKASGLLDDLLVHGSDPHPAPTVEGEKTAGFLDGLSSLTRFGKMEMPNARNLRVTEEQARGITGDAEVTAVARKPDLDRAGLSAADDPMVRPEFVARFRSLLAETPAQNRMPALIEYAKGNDVWGRAARQILRQAEAENSRIRPEDEALARRIGKIGPASGGGSAAQPPTPIPDPRPSFGDIMDGNAPPDVVERRLTAGQIAAAGRPTMKDASGARFGFIKRDVEGDTPGLLEGAIGAVANDKIVAAVKALPTAQSFAIGAVNFLTGGALDAPSEGLERVNQYLDSFKSAHARQVAKNFAQIASDGDKGVVDAIAYLATEPSYIADSVIENLGAMLVGSAGGGAAVKATDALGRRLAGKGASEAERIAKANGFLGGEVRAIEVAKKELQALRERMATIGAASTDAAMGAGSVFNDAEMRDRSTQERVLSGINTALGYGLIARFSGGGAAGELARHKAGQRSVGNQAIETIKSTAREGGEEFAQKFAEEGGKSIATGEDFDASKTAKEGALDLLTGAATGGGVHIVTATSDFLRPQKAMPPLQAKSEAIKRFDKLAAAHGINSAAAQSAKAAAADTPADEVPGFLARFVNALTKRRLVAKPIDQQSLQTLGQALGDKPAEPAPEADKASQAVDNIESILRRGGALPDSEAGRPPAATGGADGQTQEEAQGLLKQDAPADVTTAGAQQQDGAPKVEGEPINRKWTAFAPESGTLSIPREQMPQVDAEHRGALVNFLAARGVAADQETVAADSLKPTQREFEPGKVKAMAEGGGSKRRILVSSDDHILDGHHQWLAKREAGQPVDIIRLDAPVQDLLRLAHQFPSSTTAKGPERKGPNEQHPGLVEQASAGQSDQPAGGTSVAGSLAVRRGKSDDATAGSERADRGGAASALGLGTGGKVGRVANAKPELPDPAAVAAGGADEPGAAGARSGGDQRPDPDVGVGRDGPSSAPAPSGRAAGLVGDGGGSDAALKPRILGSYGRTPAGATQIELRPNDDGTLTPYTGKYAMVEHESGEPIRVPADATDAEVVDAIRASGAVTNRDRFFGVKAEKADKSSAAPADAGKDGNSGGGEPDQPGAATQPEAAQDAQARKAELVQRATWLRKLIKCLGS